MSRAARTTGSDALGRLVTDWARRDPRRAAIEHDGAVLSYGELDARAGAVAATLRQGGLGPGTCLATLSESKPEQVVLLLGCARAGVALAPLNRRLAAAELAVQIDLLRPALLACSATQRGLGVDSISRAASPAPLAELDSLTESLAEVLGVPDAARAGRAGSRGRTPARAGSGRDARGVRPDDPLLVVFTSGSTGRAKAAVLTQSNCFWTNASLDAVLPLTPGDVVLQVLPQCHVGGWNVQPLQALAKGATLLLESTFDPARVLELIARRRVTTMMGVPTNYQLLAEQDGFARADLSSLRCVVSGGAAMPAALLALWLGRGVPVAQGYGLTEAAPNVLCQLPADPGARSGWVGTPYPYVDVELRDLDGAPLPPGAAEGELYVRGPNVFAGYLGDAAATAEVLRGGWLRTGDLAERDADGRHRISGRAKELYISGGENVSPAEVEAALLAHPAVAGAAVVAVPDARWGEAGAAYVELRPGHDATPAQLSEACRAVLARFKVPRDIVVVDALPRLASGKVDKPALRAAAGAGRHGSERPGPQPLEVGRQQPGGAGQPGVT